MSADTARPRGSTLPGLPRWVELFLSATGRAYRAPSRRLPSSTGRAMRAPTTNTNVSR